PDLMFFLSANDDVFLGLAGSAHHIIGNVRPPTATTSFSNQGGLLRTLSTVEGARSYLIEQDDAALSHFLLAGVTQSGVVSAWTRILDELGRQIEKAPTQKVEFLARKLISEVVP